MRHVSYEQWTLYVADRLEDRKREEFEDHMYECDQCMALYMQAVEEHESTIPDFDETGVADQIMKEISNLTKIDNVIELAHYSEAKKEKDFSRLKKQMVNYFLAAAMTLLLMSTGVFQTITAYVADYEDSNASSKTSVTKGLLNKTVSLVDKVEKETKEDK